MISARTKDALAAAMMRGVKLGGDRGATVSKAGHSRAAALRAKQADAKAADPSPGAE